MIKKIKPETFHLLSTTFYGKHECFAKLSEEIVELQQAIYNNDLENITEEMADVEICIPYLEKIMPASQDEYRIESCDRKIDFKDSSDMLLQAIGLYKKYNDIKAVVDLCSRSTQLMCHALYYLYKDYKISPHLVDDIKDFKKKRTILRRIGRGDN